MKLNSYDIVIGTGLFLLLAFGAYEVLIRRHNEPAYAANQATDDLKRTPVEPISAR